MRQKQPQAKRPHTPVWQVIWSVRPRLQDAVGIQKRRKKASPTDSTVHQVVQTGKDTVVVGLQLLHLLLRHYDPKKGPYIRWLDPKRDQKSVVLQEQKDGSLVFWILQISKDICIVGYELLKFLMLKKEAKKRPVIRWMRVEGQKT